jgi:hypothetical protein
MFPIAQRLRTKDGPELMTDALVFAFLWALADGIGRGIQVTLFADGDFPSEVGMLMYAVAGLFGIAAKVALIAGVICLLTGMLRLWHEIASQREGD